MKNSRKQIFLASALLLLSAFLALPTIVSAAGQQGYILLSNWGYAEEEEPPQPEYPVPTEEEAYQRIIEQRIGYPEGSTFPADQEYEWDGGGRFSYLKGYSAWPFMLSDVAFGLLPSREVTNITIADVHIGDILRINNDTYSVIILEKHEDYVIVVDGYYNSTIHWDRKLTAAQVAASTSMITRYPVGTSFVKMTTITYDSNGGNNAPSAQYYEEGGSTTLTVDTPTRPYHTFKGWSTSATSQTVEYAPGATVSFQKNTTLYAVWEESCAVLSNITPSVIPLDFSTGEICYSFTPAKTAAYTFESHSNLDTCITVYNSANNTVDSNDDGGNDFNFKLSTSLTAGQTYYLVIRLYSDSVSTEEATLSISSTADTAASVYAPITLCGVNLSLINDGSFGITYQVAVTDGYQSTATAKLMIGSTTLVDTTFNQYSSYASTTLSVGQQKIPASIYEISVTIAPQQMSEPISASFCQNGTQEAGAYWSYRDITDKYLKDDSYQQYYALIKASLNYGAAVQQYFGITPGFGLANRFLSESDRKIDHVAPNSSFEKKVTGSVDGIEYLGSSIILEDCFIARHYYKPAQPDNCDSYSFNVNDVPVSASLKGDILYVESPAVLIGDSSAASTITVTKGSQKQTLQYSILSYLRDAYDNNSDPNLTALMDAIQAFANLFTS